MKGQYNSNFQRKPQNGYRPRNNGPNNAPVSVFATPYVAPELNSSDKYISVDVECVASGSGHNDRVVASVAVVDIEGNVLLYKMVKPSVPVFSYLTVITGITEDSLKDGEPQETVLAEVHALLGPNVVIIGQSPQSDIKWLQLEEGVHFYRIVDLADVFQFEKPNGRVFKFSLEHEVRTLLMTAEDRSKPQQHHTAINDAANSMELYKRYGDGRCSPAVLKEAAKSLNCSAVIPSFAKSVNYLWEGVCMAAFSPHACTCGQPSKITAN